MHYERRQGSASDPLWADLLRMAEELLYPLATACNASLVPRPNFSQLRMDYITRNPSAKTFGLGTKL